MKTCAECGKTKEHKHFSNDKSRKDGYVRACKDCVTIYNKWYRKTKDGFMAKMYGDQRRSSRDRNHPMPPYTLKEFREWCHSQEIFHTLWDNWVASGYDKNLSPSNDRIDDYKPYTFDNIFLDTWGENEQNGHRSRKEGRNNKVSRAVIQMDMNGNFIAEYWSIRDAARRLDMKNHKGIINCCNGTAKHSYHFRWEYKE